MHDHRKNFWIFLTAFAMVFTVSKWLYQEQAQSSFSNKTCVQKRHKTISPKAQRQLRYAHQNRRSRCNVSSRSLSAPAIDEFVFVDQEPVVSNMAEMRKLIGNLESPQGSQLQGLVIARILVDKYGKYQRHQILSQTHPTLRARCDQHLRKLTFSPALKNGKPIPYWVNIPLQFGN